MYYNFECYHEALTWKPDFVILNQISQNENIAFAKYLKKCGTRVIVLNAELVFLEEDMYFKYAADCNDYVDYLFESGGDRKFKLLCKYSHLARNKIKMMGTPKLDPYLDVVRKKFPITRPYQGKLNPAKKTVCICTSFCFSNGTWNKVKNNIAYQRLGKTRVESTARTQRELQRKFIELTKNIVRTGRCNVIFRCHPLEDSQTYHRAFDSIPEIIFDNTIHPAELFTAADLIIHRSSTLAVESWIYNIPSVSYDPIPTTIMPLSQFARFEKVIHDQSMLLAFVKWFLRGREAPFMVKERKKYLQDSFGFKKNAQSPASKRIAAFMTTIPVSDKRFVLHPYIIYFYTLNMLRILFFKKHIYEVIGMVKGPQYMKKVIHDST